MWGSILLAALTLALVTASCGPEDDSSSATEEWVNELYLIGNEFRETRRAAFNELRTATQPGNLPAAAAAYRDYAKDLSDMINDISEVDPPSGCEEQQRTIEGVALAAQELSQDLSNPSVLTSRARFSAAAAEAEPEIVAFAETMSDLQQSGEC